MKLIPTVVMVIIFFLSTGSATLQKPLDEAAVAANNLGVGLMGQFEYEKAQKVFEDLTKKYPKNWNFQTNLAIATLNIQKEGMENKALSILTEVLKNDPKNLRAQYCSGLLELRKGNSESALKFFQSVIQSDPNDAETLYFAGKTLMQLSRYEEAIEHFKRSLSVDDYIRSNQYGMIMAFRQLGKTKEAMAKIEEFQRLRTNPRTRLVEFKYTKMGPKAEVLAIDLPNTQPKKKPTGALFDTSKTIADNSGIPWRQRDDSTSINSSITICDINCDNHPDIFITGAIKVANGFGNALFQGNPGQDKYTFDGNHPLTKITGVNTALWGDINNDGYVDVYLCRRGPNQLWFQEAPGKWQNVTETTGTSNGSLDTLDGALYDADHDGDLDIFLINANGPNELLNNNRNGTFRPLAADYGLSGKNKASRSLVITDLDADRDADIVVINKNPPHEVYMNQRLWKYHPADQFNAFISSDIIAAVAGDINADGKTEIYTLNSKEILTQWQYNANGKWVGTPFNNHNGIKPSPWKYTPRLALVDVDGDGMQEIFISGSKGWWAATIDQNQLKKFHTITENTKECPASWSIINSNRGPALLGWVPGKAPLLYPPGPGRYSFASLKLSGRKDSNSQWRSNASGIGTRVSIRVNSHWTLLDTFRSNSGPGQGLQPVTVGLGGAKRIDFVAFDWSDGVYQTELGLDEKKLHHITEIQRQLSSCPVLFAWNGHTYQFVSDLLGVGGIGYAIGPGEYAEPRPWENFMLPPGLLQPKNGKLTVKLMEPMEEVAYIDTINLKMYDLPPGWSMTLDERMGISGPMPTGAPLFYQNILIPSKAINNRNEDVTAEIIKTDLKAAPVGELDHRFIGRLQQEHILTITFPQSLDHFPGKPILLADGWLEYPYSQTSFAAWQAGADFQAPTIEALQPNGKWITIIEQFGYPAGMPRQMSLPLPALSGGIRTIRISTNQEIYWDRLAIAFAIPCPDANSQELDLDSAYLNQVGYPQRINRPQRVPEYQYEKRKPFWDTHFLEGFYTRFGRIDELIEKMDNGLVIFGAGEEIQMDFIAPLMPLKKGWNRVYVLETKGWCKDMDLFTNTGDTIEPIPSIGKRDRHIEDLHNQYNIRYLSGKQ